MKFGVALLSASALGVCPPAGFDTVDNFDLDVFISNRWFIQQQMEVDYLPKENNYCVTAEYKKKENFNVWGYDLDVYNHAEEKDGTVHDSGDLLKAKIVNGEKGQLAVAPWFVPSYFAGPYWILAHDEAKGYALISGGPPTIESNGKCKTGSGKNNSGLWIFTREQPRNQELVDTVREIATAKGFDLSVLNDVDHTNCGKGQLNDIVGEIISQIPDKIIIG